MRMRVFVDPEPRVFVSWDNSTVSCTAAPPFTHDTLAEAIAAIGALQERPLFPSDPGLDGAIPLPPDEWHPAFTDEGWAAQNRKINDLLMGRAG